MDVTFSASHGMNLQEVDAPYVFADSGGIFTVRWHLISSDQKHYIGGLKAGTDEDITSKQYDEFQQAAEKKFGKYLPGGLIFDAKFIPGTDRKTLPIGPGGEDGYIDENGPHYFRNRFEAQRFKNEV